MTEVPLLPCADVWVDDVMVAPGTVALVTVHVTSRLTDPAEFTLRAVGLEAAWVVAPPSLGTLQPGTAVAVELQLQLPLGYPAATITGSVSVEAIGTRSRPSSTDLNVTVGDGSVIGASLEPSEIHGRRFEVVLRNRSKAAMRVELSAGTPDEDLRIDFATTAPVLEPGYEVRVKAKVHASRPVAGEPQRRHFTVRVQGRSTPVALEGSVMRRSVVPHTGFRLVAILAVIALWAAVAVVGISALEKHEKKTANAKAIASAPPLSPGGNPSGGAGTAGKGAGGGSGSGGAGGGGNGSGSGSSGGGSGADRVGGRVTATQAGGVKVTIAPTSLVAAQTEGALTPANEIVTTAAISESAAQKTAATEIPAGMVYAGEASASLDPELTAATAPEQSTTTTADGSWAFAKIPAPDTFLVTFSKDGYTTVKYVVTTSTSGAVTLNTSLTAGTGTISGAVFGSNGPLGGATVEITDGTISVTTRTPSVGTGIGTWSANGLTTPDTYLITATAPGYGTQTSVVTLGAGASRSGVDLSMSSGLGAITGTVSSATGPQGGVTVTASGGDTMVSTTTSTVNPVGSYVLPNLPIPGTYALTISGPGWVTQTERVTLPDSKPVNVFLVASTGDINGIVTIGPDNVKQSGVGLILSNQSATYKTLTTDTGGYEFQSIPPGNYLLTAEYYGYITQSAQITVRSGGPPIRRNLHLPKNGRNTEDQGTIQGLAIDLFTSGPAVDVNVLLNGKQVVVGGKDLVTSGQGTYTIPDVPPGLQQVELVDSNTNAGGEGGTASVDLQTTDVQVTVPLNGVGVAPTAEMDKLDTYSGSVTSAAAGTPVVGATVRFVQTTTGHPAVPGVSAATTGSNGTFSIGRIPAGNYEVETTGPVHADGSDDFQSSIFPVTMGPDVDLQQQEISLTLLPSFQVIPEEVNSAGTGFGPIGGVCVTLTDTTHPDKSPAPKYSGEFPADHDEVYFGGLTAGDSYTAAYTAYSSATCAPSANPATALSTTFTATANNIQVDQVFVANKVKALAVPVSYSLVGVAPTPTSCPVQLGDGPVGPGSNACVSPATLPTVTLTGLSGFDGSGNPIDTTITARYCDGLASCPAGTPQEGIWFFSTSDLAKFIGPSATLTVGGDPFTFQTYTQTVTLGTGTAPSQPAELTPLPVSISGSGPSIPDLTVQAVPSSVSVTGEGSNLVWSQPPEPSGQALPGEYTLTYSAPDYEASGTGASSITQSVSVGLCNSPNCEVAEPLNDSSLVHQPSVAITPTGIPAGVTATITLYLNGVPVSADPPQTIQTGGTATFAGLSPHAQAAAGQGTKNVGYGYSVSAPGTATLSGDFPYYSPDDGKPADDPFSALTIPDEPNLSLTPTLTPAPSIGGSVTGTVAGSASALSGVTVTATLQNSCATNIDQYAPPGAATDSFPSTLTATTAEGTGAYLLTAQADTSTGGTDWLCPNADYVVTVSASGYNSYTSPALTTSGTGVENVLNPNLDATPFDQPVNVAGPPAGTTVIVEAIPLAGDDFFIGQGVTDQNVDCSTSQANVCATNLQPVPYEYVVSAAGYEPFEQLVTYSPGSCGAVCSPVTFQLVPDQVTVSGTVTLGNGTPVAGLKIDLDIAGDNPPTQSSVAPVVTGAGGTFTFNDVPNGAYYITPDPSTGYELPDGPVTFDAEYPNSLQETVTVAATPVDVTVTAGVAALADPNLSGATITLTPDPSGDIKGCNSGPPTSASDPTPECTGNLPLLATGAAGTSAVTATLAPSGGSTTQFTASFTSLTPDIYIMTVGGNGVPSQTGIVVEIAPDTTATDAASLTVFEGEISGSITWDSSLQSTAETPTVSASGATIYPTPVTCNNPGTCTYAAYLPLGSSGTINASLTGYANGSTGSVAVSSGDPSATPPAVNLAPIDRTVDITAVSDGSSTFTLSGASIQLSNSSTGYSETKNNTDGTATFDNVPPSATDYNVTITYDGTASSGLTLSVPLATSASPPDIASNQILAAGQLSGRVTLASGQSGSTVKLFFCSASAAGSASACNASNATVTLSDPGGTYSEILPLGSYWVGQSTVTGFDDGTSEATASSVGEGTTTTGPTISYTTPPPPTTT